ncbi:hypothetical protein [Kitasatospora sp. NBC_01302]|uniref:hypothetical protein n=1 Tax=Kitasatospora sp. NBC_01302 TaxID=2903575 RepID=UPI002E0D2CEF|nr:hypothetical protein OG294_40600 [Kitasatospora sp. NBC_01302]
MTLTDAEIGDLLAPAGFRFIERIQGEVRLPSLPPYYSPASAGPEHGRFDSHQDEIVDVGASDMADKVNASWYRMATEFGLFDANREYLLAVNRESLGEEPDDEPFTVWLRVRLLDGWDLVGSEVDLLRSGFATLFTTRFVPEFTVASLEGQMMMNTTVWGNGTVSTIVIRP